MLFRSDRSSCGWNAHLPRPGRTSRWPRPPDGEIIHQQMGGLRSCMGLTGCGTIDELRTKAEFVRISGAGIQESHVHDVTITKESPNYRLGS